MPKLLFARTPINAAEARGVGKLARSRRAPADLIRRAQIIELSWSRVRVPDIAARLRCSEKAVRYRIRRFNAEGMDGLVDRRRVGVGRKPRITGVQRSQIVALARTTPPPGRLARRNGHQPRDANTREPVAWTLDRLTSAVRHQGIDIGRSQVRRILLAEGVRWER